MEIIKWKKLFALAFFSYSLSVSGPMRSGSCTKFQVLGQYEMKQFYGIIKTK